MRRRGFIVNSTVIVLLIPILLLSAVYSQVHFQINQYQGERMELEKLRWAIEYIDNDLKNTVQISGRRAILAMVNYTVTTGNYLTKANETMRNLMLTGKINGVPMAFMGNQTIGFWLNSVSNALLKRGLVMTPPKDLNSAVQMEIVPLTSFQIGIKVRINNVTIKDVNGKVVYQGSLPPRGYIYSVININNVEDPVYAVATNGQYHRIIHACGFMYPELGNKPISWVTGTGNSSSENIVGTYGKEILFNSTAIWVNSPPAKMFNLSRSPLGLFSYGDRGYLHFSNVSVPVTAASWPVSTDYRYRVNFTVNNYKPNQLTLLIINTNEVTIGTETMNEWVAHTTSKAAIQIYDSNGNPVHFWIEYWDSNGKLWLWMKTTNASVYSMYLSNDTNLEWRGDGEDLFYLLDDFLSKNTDLWHYSGGTVQNGWLTFDSTANGVRVAISNATFSGPFFVRWGMNTSAVNAGVGLYRPPTGGQNYLDVVVRYDWIYSSSVYWPYNTSGTSSVSSLDSIRLSYKRGYTRYIYSLADAQIAKEWLDEQLAEINGTRVYYGNYQIPIYLNATQVQGINYNPTTNSADIEIVDDKGNPVPFWIEYWNSSGALIWVKVNLTERYYTEIENRARNGTTKYIYDVSNDNGVLSYLENKEKIRGHTYYYIVLNAYIGTNLKIIYNTGTPTRGDGDRVFEFFDDFNGSFLNTTKWNIEQSGGSYSISNGMLTLISDNNDWTSDIWLWTKKTFPERYVIGMRVKIGSLADQGWLWYINSSGWGWMEDVYYDTIGRRKWAQSRTFGHLYDFNVNNGSWDYQEDGGEYTADKWSYVELAIDAGDFTTYQSLKPLVWNWSYINRVSVYIGYNSKSSEPIGLVQFKGSTEYDFIYVRKYLDLSYLSESITKHEASNRPLEYEFTGSSTQLAIWKNWGYPPIKSTADGPGTFARYGVNVSSGEVNFTRINGATIDYTGDFSGTWNVSIVARGAGEAEFDWIIVGPQYVTSGVTFGRVETPGNVVWNLYTSVAFDLQPFLNCLANDSYFGLYEAPSFFERLEGKLNPENTGINGEYWKASMEMQREMGIAGNGHYYPIGLVSFIYYPTDEDLLNYLAFLGESPNDAITNSISFADYYWLSYYFNFPDSATPAKGYRVWGISMATGDYSYLSGVGFLMDNGTATVLLGNWAWKYLQYRG